ncbi:MAG: heme-binding protein [Vicinamibacterales bacterium]
MKHFMLSAVGLLALAATASAQQVASKQSLTIEGARRVVAAALAEAKAVNAPGGVVAVVDDGGNLMALERLDGTFAAGAQISIGKARTAALFKRPTKAFEDIIKNGRTAMVALPDALFTPLQGGVPITIGGQIVGAVGVSGASSADQDEQLAAAGARALAETAPATGPMASAGSAPTATVRYFDKAQVESSFAKGAVLFDASDKYMVHTSRRDKASMAEVHERDADIIYVIDGAATFVTGGAVVEGVPSGPGEIRGSSIAGGTTRRIAKGDVIVVPAGTPHWFKELSGPVTYYVVKAR